MRPPRLRPNIKAKMLVWMGAILAMFAIAVSANADFAMPEVPGFSNNYPWFNNVSQNPGNESFQYFLAYHPNIAQALARNPSLLYNASWRYQFPALEQYLANHPYEWQALSGQDWAEGIPETPWGGYDQEHQWRDAYWWHANDPNWFYDHHQAWASLDSRWLTQDGAYDARHQWHYGEWWYNQNPNWVTANHPNWLKEHRNWQSASEQQSYRKQHAMSAQGPQNQRSATLERQANVRQANAEPARQHTQEVKQTEANQQHAAAQRQASAQREQNIQRSKELQHPANRSDNQHQQEAKREQSPQQARRPVPVAAHHASGEREASREQHQQAPKAEHQQPAEHDQKGEK